MRSERRYGLVVFDWDGTLIDSAATIVECIQAAAREMDLPVPDAARARHVIGLGLHDSLRYAVPELERSGYAEFAERYRRHFIAGEPRMQAFAGVPELLQRLRTRGHVLAIATGKSRAGLERALRMSGLALFFTASRCADEAEPKPDPAMLLELMAELAIDAAACLMIGDTSHDLEMARSAGVDAVGVAYGAHPHSALEALRPRGCVASVSALGEWLEANA